jgi:hypothetical protein
VDVRIIAQTIKHNIHEVVVRVPAEPTTRAAVPPVKHTS